MGHGLRESALSVVHAIGLGSSVGFQSNGLQTASPSSGRRRSSQRMYFRPSRTRCSASGAQLHPLCLSGSSCQFPCSLAATNVSSKNVTHESTAARMMSGACGADVCVACGRALVARSCVSTECFGVSVVSRARAFDHDQRIITCTTNIHEFIHF